MKILLRSILFCAIDKNYIDPNISSEYTVKTVWPNLTCRYDSLAYVRYIFLWPPRKWKFPIWVKGKGEKIPLSWAHKFVELRYSESTIYRFACNKLTCYSNAILTACFSKMVNARPVLNLLFSTLFSSRTH